MECLSAGRRSSDFWIGVGGGGGQVIRRFRKLAFVEILPLKLWRGGAFRTLEFRREELVDVEGDPEVQRKLGERIRAGLGGSEGAGAP